MQICGNCGMPGTKENGWAVPNHKCRRDYNVYSALENLYTVCEAYLEDNLQLKHLIASIQRVRRAKKTHDNL